GKDEFLVSGQLHSLISSLLEPEQMQMSLLQVDGDKITAIEVFDELRTLPFLAERRVVVLNDADKFVSEYREILEKYFESPAAKGVLVLVVKSWPANTRLAKMLPKNGKLIAVAELKGKSLVSYVTNYASERHGKNLSYNAGCMLVEFAGEEPGVLCSEVDKLAAYTDKAKAITEKDIAAIVGRNRVFGVFEVIDAMTAGDLAGAIEKLRRMFGSDKGADYTVVGAFAWHFRRMFSASAMLKEGQSQDAVAKKLRIWNNSGFFAALRKMPLEKIGGCLRQLAEIDYEIKTGRATARVAIESMILGLAGKN
ncbi:MAG: DNA polymerase III subunit delta, partial [Phycisphaerae bacterium]|nr:DNA polymerase III subunit delta [Phycisphaerae bacterium]